MQLFGLARELNYLNTESFMSVEKRIIFNRSVVYSYLKSYGIMIFRDTRLITMGSKPDYVEFVLLQLF